MPDEYFMTRLITDDIAHVTAALADFERDLTAKTGQTLRGLACNAAGVEESVAIAALSRCRAHIVPVSWGAGLIEGFCETIAAILNRIGLTANVTRRPNVSGFLEVFYSHGDLVFISDDDDFAVFNLNQKKCIHNAAATGRGFAAGLDLMAGGIRGCGVLVIGCGPVGAAAAFELMRRGAQVAAYDSDPIRRRALVDDLSAAVTGVVFEARNIEDALGLHDYIIDATPASDIVAAEVVGPRTFVAAPGMPLGLTAAAVEKVGKRLLHDPLQIGVATMAIEALTQMPVDKTRGAI